MFELPKFTTLGKQINQTMAGKAIKKVVLGNVQHRFV